jgi:hypothetical protein
MRINDMMIGVLKIVITLHIGYVHHLVKYTACADGKINYGEPFFYLQVLLPQVSKVNLNQ